MLEILPPLPPTPSSTLVGHSSFNHLTLHKADQIVVPYEDVLAAAEAAPAAPGGTNSPPPTFAAATTADGLMDSRNVVTDTSQGTSRSAFTPRSGNQS